jgi:hypothetical protein
MPRNGSGVWSAPAGTLAIPNEEITSVGHNTLVDDIGAEFNSARPIVAGGTGATTAAAARTGLGVDQAATYATKSGNYTAVAADNNAIIRFSAAATLSLAATSTLSAGWHVTIIADGGTVTVDPNGSEQINASTTLPIPQGVTATIIRDGSAFRSTSVSGAGVADMRNYLSGFTLSNNSSDATNDIDVDAGSCVDSTNTSVINLGSALTKRLDAAWTVGTGQGGLDTGSIANATYHLFAIKRPDTGVVDVLFSTSATSPTMPANYTIRRRIGSIIRASGSIRAFSQFGDEFLLQTPVLDVDVAQGTLMSTRTLTVPSGIKAWAKLRLRGDNAGSNWGILVSALDVPDVDPQLVDTPGVSIGAVSGSGDRNDIDIRTNTSGQVRTRATTAATNLQIITYGWTDTRGK